MGRRQKGVSASVSEPVMAFLKRRAVLLAIAFVVIASLRIVSTYDRLSLTFDEPAHMACGMEYVAKHVYRYESQHPPLSRAMIAIGPYLAGVRLHGIERFMQEASRK
jgi:dolichyl-phosphate-mannose--protein O-mannosyl transferase